MCRRASQPSRPAERAACGISCLSLCIQMLGRVSKAVCPARASTEERVCNRQERSKLRPMAIRPAAPQQLAPSAIAPRTRLSHRSPGKDRHGSARIGSAAALSCRAKKTSVVSRAPSSGSGRCRSEAFDWLREPCRSRLPLVCLAFSESLCAQQNAPATGALLVDHTHYRLQCQC